MFLRNKFLLFLLTCTIANPCFGNECSGTTLFCTDVGTGNIILNQTQWNEFSNNIDNLYHYINTSATAFDELLNNTTDTTKPSIKSRIEDLYKSKNALDALINGSDPTSLAQRIISLGTEVGSFSQKLETLDGLIDEVGSFGVISQGLTDTTQQLSGAIHNLQNIQFRPIVLNLGCAEGYYVAKCGDINLDVGTILGYVNEYYNIDSSCWNQDKPYEEMRYLLHLDNDDDATYTSEGSTFRTHFGGDDKHTCTGDIATVDTEMYQLQELRKNIFDTCISSSYVCLKCPDDGQTDVKTELILAQSATYNTDGSLNTDAVPAHWNSFNTIADCFTLGGSDAKGTFKLETPYNYNSTTHKATGDKCYYDY